jgi:hypothetical protein
MPDISVLTSSPGCIFLFRCSLVELKVVLSLKVLSLEPSLASWAGLLGTWALVCSSWWLAETAGPVSFVGRYSPWSVCVCMVSFKGCLRKFTCCCFVKYDWPKFRHSSSYLQRVSIMGSSSMRGIHIGNMCKLYYCHYL